MRFHVVWVDTEGDEQSQTVVHEALLDLLALLAAEGIDEVTVHTQDATRWAFNEYNGPSPAGWDVNG